jgi:DNA-binding FadR family transcriptional regulator
LKTTKDLRSYLQHIQAEHCAIAAAIDAGDVSSARRAMRRHLAGSRERYQRLAAKSEELPVSR